MPNTASDPIVDHVFLVAPEATGQGPLAILSANLKNPFAALRIAKHDQIAARLEAFARLAETTGAGVLLCQEVGRSREFRVDSWLAARLNMACVYIKANGDAARLDREEGLAIFSRYPLTRPVTCFLAGGIWRRPALGVLVDTPLGEIAAYTTHLSLRPWRNKRQPAKLRTWIEATAGPLPAIIGGDFNAGETAPHIIALRSVWQDTFRALHPMADGTTYELKLLDWKIRRRRFDYIFLRQLILSICIVKSIHVQATSPFSDHQAVLTVLSK